ncbi:MAG: ABC transporter ATP-binding protein [Alphaproteobacteria bacterium]|nr:ABC transporter ATP-binding protein [Alphaproteobacteria bacterium]
MFADAGRHENEEKQSILHLSGIFKSYGQKEPFLEVLKGIDLLIPRGQTIALVGPSGSGKSTLLHITGLLEKPTKGAVIIDSQDAYALSDAARTALRRRAIGFIFQLHRLLPEFSALENIIIPQRIAGLGLSESLNRARQLLSMLGLSERANHRPAELSGGEQQRISIARALSNVPYLLLADEPTGNLDHKTALGVFETILEIVRQSGLSAFIATHDLDLAQRMDRRILLTEGRLEES